MRQTLWIIGKNNDESLFKHQQRSYPPDRVLAFNYAYLTKKIPGTCTGLSKPGYIFKKLRGDNNVMKVT